MTFVPPGILASLDFPAILDGLPLGVAVLDREGRVVTLNAALERLTGFAREEVRGVPCRHVLRSGLCHRHCPVQGPADTEIINRHRRKIPVRISAIPVRDTKGQDVYRIDLVEDPGPCMALAPSTRCTHCISTASFSRVDVPW